MIIAIVALSALEVVFGIFFCTNIYLHASSRGKCYTILKFIGIISADIGPISLVLVTPKHSWWMAHVVISVICVVFGTMAASLFAWVCRDTEDDLSKSSSTFAYLELVLVPLSLVLVLFVANKLGWIVYSVMCLSLGMDFVYFFITIFKLVKQKLEAHQQDNNNDLEAQ
ncbi:hypothetical protein L1987_79720 [Smallanthus sonchifolius]|uniref:Uncharacterized protein n=1 Tax=Smallanthus sonchifolius TaxID=185202 RepID=A0ACB8YPV9_9ASTR|nr:hypothetical protein L1987_79720 [Smallanthus sonchifolius]